MTISANVYNIYRHSIVSETHQYEKKDPDELVDVSAQNPTVTEMLHAKLDRYISSGWDITKGTFNEIEL